MPEEDNQNQSNGNREAPTENRGTKEDDKKTENKDSD